jgi:hypothetical protein
MLRFLKYLQRILPRAVALIWVCISGCSSASRTTAVQAEKIAAVFGYNSINVIAQFSHCVDIGSTCYFVMYFTTSPVSASQAQSSASQLAHSAATLGLVEDRGDVWIGNWLQQASCLNNRLTVNGKCIKTHDEAKRVANPQNAAWYGAVDGWQTSVTVYAVSQSSDTYMLDGKPLTDDVVVVQVRDKK